jgi:hypothetical protein
MFDAAASNIVNEISFNFDLDFLKWIMIVWFLL